MSRPRRSSRGPARSLLLIAACVIVVAGLKAAGPILEPFLLATFLALLSFPFLEWLRGLGVRTGLAVVTTVLADLAVLIGLALLVSGAVNEFAVTAPEYLNALVGRLRHTLTLLEERGIDLAEWIAIEPIDPRQFVDVAGGLVGGTVRGVLSALAKLTLVAATLIFVLFELVVLPAKLRSAVGSEGDLSHHFESVSREVQRYLGVKTGLSVATGLLIGFWVLLLGVDFPLLWGLLAFLLNYIPVLGSILAAVPAVLVTLVEFDWSRTLLVGVGYLVVNIVVGNLIEPHLMGRKFGLSATVVLISLIFWGWIWGPLGMILSVPLTMTIKIACQYSERLRWIAVLLGPARASP